MIVQQKKNLEEILIFSSLYKDDKPANYGKNFTPSDILKITCMN